jgi:hypothetical protein
MSDKDGSIVNLLILKKAPCYLSKTPTEASLENNAGLRRKSTISIDKPKDSQIKIEIMFHYSF